MYSTFDWGIRDEDGYYFILGRTDDVINVAGHRLGHARNRGGRSARIRPSPKSRWSASPTQLKGQVPVAFAVLKDPAPIADAAQRG